MEMRIGVDVGVDRGSHEACCGDGRGGKVICARNKGMVWVRRWSQAGAQEKKRSNDRSLHGTRSGLGLEALASGRMEMECGVCMQVMKGGCARNEQFGNECPCEQSALGGGFCKAKSRKCREPLV